MAIPSDVHVLNLELRPAPPPARTSECYCCIVKHWELTGEGGGAGRRVGGPMEAASDCISQSKARTPAEYVRKCPPIASFERVAIDAPGLAGEPVPHPSELFGCRLLHQRVVIKPGTVDVFDRQTQAASFLNASRDIGDGDRLIVVAR